VARPRRTADDREAYGDKSPFAFTGTVKKVVFDLVPHPKERYVSVVFPRPLTPQTAPNTSRYFRARRR
jgi:hypothetical protein